MKTCSALRPGSLLSRQFLVQRQYPCSQRWRQPGRCISLTSTHLAEVSSFSLCGCHPQVPEEWSIGLMPVDKKAFLRIVKGHLKTHVLRRLRKLPQYACRSSSSAVAGILRASSHCADVRALLGSYNSELAWKIAGVDRQELMGSLWPALTLRRRFTLSPNGQIFVSLQGRWCTGAATQTSTSPTSADTARHCAWQFK